MNKYRCAVCLTDGWHYDEDGKASRCPNYLSTVQHEQALELTKQQHTKAFEAAKDIIRDAAQTLMEFSSNDTWDAMETAQIPSGTVGRAFTACADEGAIENTKRLIDHRDKSVRHRIYRWKSLVHPAYLAANFSAGATGRQAS